MLFRSVKVGEIHNEEDAIKEIAKLEKAMQQAARDLQFEEAAVLRDRIRGIKENIEKSSRCLFMKKYFSIFVLSALSAYSVQAADTAQQLRKRDRVQLPVLKILPTQDGAAGGELVMLLDIDEKGRVKRRVWQEGKAERSESVV